MTDSRRATIDASTPRPETVAVVDSIRRILRSLRISAQDTQGRTGISSAQLFVLQALRDGEEASLSELAVRTLTDRTSVASAVDRLQAAGMVRRGTSEADRRRAAVTLTVKGRNLLRRAPEAPTARLISSLHEMPIARVRALAAGLSALTDELGISGDPAEFMFDDTSEGTAPRPRASRARVGA